MQFILPWKRISKLHPITHEHDCTTLTISKRIIFILFLDLDESCSTGCQFSSIWTILCMDRGKLMWIVDIVSISEFETNFICYYSIVLICVFHFASITFLHNSIVSFCDFNVAFLTPPWSLMSLSLTHSLCLSPHVSLVRTLFLNDCDILRPKVVCARFLVGDYRCHRHPDERLHTW